MGWQRGLAQLEAPLAAQLAENARPRPLTEIQRFVQYFVAATYNGNSTDVLVLDRPLDREVLRRALSAWVGRHPVLNALTVRRGFRRFSWAAQARPLPLAIGYQKLESSSEEAVHEQLEHNTWGRPFDLARERPIRFHYLETPTRSYLQAVTARVYTDGITGDLILRGMADAYSTFARGDAYDATVADLDERGNRLFLAALPLPARARSWLVAGAELARLLLRSGRGLVALDGPYRQTKVARVDLGPRSLEQIRAFAKREDTTVHAVLSLALVRACAAYNHRRGVAPDLFRYTDFFSMRGFASRDVSQLFDSFSIPYGTTVDQRLDDNALLAAIHGRLKALKNGRILGFLRISQLTLLAAAALPMSRAIPWLTKIEPSNVLLSNTGPMLHDIERVGSARLVDTIGYSQLFPPGRLFIIASSFRGVLRLTVLHDPGAFPNGVDELIHDFRQALARLTTSPADCAGAAHFQHERHEA